MNKGMTLAVAGVLILVVVGAAVLMMSRGDQNVQTSADSSMVTVPTDATTPLPEGSADGDVIDEGSEETGVKVFTVTGSNFKFDPAEMRVKKGETVRILFKSEGAMPHDFVIDEYEVATNQLGAGEEEEVEFVADQAGTFEYYCSVGSHRAMGMVGNLIVE